MVRQAHPGGPIVGTLFRIGQKLPHFPLFIGGLDGYPLPCLAIWNENTLYGLGARRAGAIFIPEPHTQRPTFGSFFFEPGLRRFSGRKHFQILALVINPSVIFLCR